LQTLTFKPSQRRCPGEQLPAGASGGASREPLRPLHPGAAPSTKKLESAANQIPLTMMKSPEDVSH
jgi:hypothetical protein